MKLVKGEGTKNSLLAIVGEAPGAEEEKQGRPFVGRSGKLVDSILEKLGISRNECYITNVVKYRPENNKTPDDGEIYRWRAPLLEELYNIHPRIILTLGTVATKAVSCLDPLEPIKDIKISKYRGKLNFNEYINVHFIPTFHPAYCLRNTKESDKLLIDFKYAIDFARGFKDENK